MSRWKVGNLSSRKSSRVAMNAMNFKKGSLLPPCPEQPEGRRQGPPDEEEPGQEEEPGRGDQGAGGRVLQLRGRRPDGVLQAGGLPQGVPRRLPEPHQEARRSEPSARCSSRTRWPSHPQEGHAVPQPGGPCGEVDKPNLSGNKPPTFRFTFRELLLSKVTYIKCICHEKAKQYSSVGTGRMFMFNIFPNVF